MARKDILDGKPLVLAQSLAADFQTKPTIISYQDNCAYQVNVTTTDSRGTFSVQGSLDIKVDANGVQTSGNWVDLLLGGGVPFVNMANDEIIIDLNQLPFKAIRLIYTSAVAGTGMCDVWIMTKQIGG